SAYRVHEFTALEVEWRNIDHHHQVIIVVGPQPCQIAARAVEYPIAQWNDEASFFRDRYNQGGRNLAFFLMPPTQQRLDTNDASIATVHHRLIMDAKCVLFNGSLELVTHMEAFGHLRVEPCRVLLPGIAPIASGADDSQIGFTQQLDGAEGGF